MLISSVWLLIATDIRFWLMMTIVAIIENSLHLTDRSILAMAFCPPRCNCNEIKLLVDCNRTRIDLVPIMLNPKLKGLNLNSNRIKNIYSSFYVYEELQFLDLSANQISDIGRKNFLQQSKLKLLLLNRNELKQIHNQSFYGLVSLLTLNLSQNRLTELTERIFLNLNQLETLDLSQNQITTINREAFLGLLNLKNLDLHSNQLKQIPTQSFFHLQQSLFKLNLGQNLFQIIPEMAFNSLTMLQELRIDSCFILDIHQRAFQHLVRLNYLHLENNQLSNVPSDSFSYLRALNSLNLSNNLITQLRSQAFRNLTNLKTLIISSSPLNEIDVNAFIENNQLERVIIENNRKLTKIHVGTFDRQLQTLEYLSLRSNMLSFLDWRTINLEHLQYLDLQLNPLICNCSMQWLVTYLKRFERNQLEILVDDDADENGEDHGDDNDQNVSFNNGGTIINADRASFEINNQIFVDRSVLNGKEIENSENSDHNNNRTSRQYDRHRIDQVKCFHPNHLYGRKLISLSESDLSCSRLNSIVKILVNILTYLSLLILIITIMIVILRKRQHRSCFDSKRWCLVRIFSKFFCCRIQSDDNKIATATSNINTYSDDCDDNDDDHTQNRIKIDNNTLNDNIGTNFRSLCSIRCCFVWFRKQSQTTPNHHTCIVALRKNDEDNNEDVSGGGLPLYGHNHLGQQKREQIQYQNYYHQPHQHPQHFKNNYDPPIYHHRNQWNYGTNRHFSFESQSSTLRPQPPPLPPLPPPTTSTTTTSSLKKNTKIRLNNHSENSYYYPIIINGEIARDTKLSSSSSSSITNLSQQHHLRSSKMTMMMMNNGSGKIKNSTRTTTSSIDLHPVPLRYVPIAHI